MEGERTLHSYLDSFCDQAPRLMPVPVARLLASFDVASQDEARETLKTLKDTYGTFPELTFLSGLIELACDHEGSPKHATATADILARSIRDVRARYAPEDFGLFLAYASVRYYDLLVLTLDSHRRNMLIVIEHLDKLDGLMDTLGIADSALQAMAHAIGVSDENDAALLAASYRTCDEAFACGAAVAMALAEGLTCPSVLSGAALEEWFGLIEEIEAASRLEVEDEGRGLSALVRPQTGLADRVRRTVERNGASEHSRRSN